MIVDLQLVIDRLVGAAQDAPGGALDWRHVHQELLHMPYPGFDASLEEMRRAIAAADADELDRYLGALGELCSAIVDQRGQA